MSDLLHGHSDSLDGASTALPPDESRHASPDPNDLPTLPDDCWNFERDNTNERGLFRATRRLFRMTTGETGWRDGDVRWHAIWPGAEGPTWMEFATHDGAVRSRLGDSFEPPHVVLKTSAREFRALHQMILGEITPSTVYVGHQAADRHAAA